MQKIVLYCKSYHRDVLRAARLVKSIRQYNRDCLPFYLSCPATDLPLFKKIIGDESVTFLTDEEILSTSNKIDREKFNSLPGYLAQQIIKSEFWRLELAENYVCLDSDSYFIRDFAYSDFMTPCGTPYTVMNESLELRTFGATHKHPQIALNIDSACEKIMSILGRTGRHYEFGPLPVIWSRHVWNDLSEKYLKPNSMNFLDAILLFPSEMRWYGEALLKFKSIELWPVETLFRCYHYEEQFSLALKSGESDQSLADIYIGICVQSNWDRGMSFGPPEKSLASRSIRFIKRHLLKRLV